MSVGYLLDEAIVPLAGGRFLVCWARNVSSHRDQAPYYRKVWDAASGAWRDLGAATAYPAPSADAFLAGVPEAMRAQLGASLDLSALPPRLPATLVPAGRARVLAYFPGAVPEPVVRLVDAVDGRVACEAPLAGWWPRAADADGRFAWCSATPGHDRFRVVALDAGLPVVAEGALPDGAIYHALVAPVWAAGAWWVPVRAGRKFLLLGLAPDGREVGRVALPAQPGGLALAEGALVAGVGREALALVELATGRTRLVKVFPGAPRHSAIQVAADGPWVAARSTLNEEVAVLRLPEATLVRRVPLPGRVDPLEAGATLHRLAGLAVAGDRLYTLLGGELTATQLP